MPDMKLTDKLYIVCILKIKNKHVYNKFHRSVGLFAY